MSMLKNDNLDAMILMSAHVLAEKNENALMEADVSNVKIPAAVELRIKRMINREHRKYAYGFIYTIGRRVAVIILTICTIAFTMVMSVEAVRDALWKTIVEWYEEHIEIIYVTETTPPHTIEHKKILSEIPNEWKSIVVLDTEPVYCVQYICDDETILWYTQYIFREEKQQQIDNKEAVVKEITVDGHSGYLINMVDKNKIYMAWNDGMYAYTIEGNGAVITEEQLIEIANSIE